MPMVPTYGIQLNPIWILFSRIRMGGRAHSRMRCVELRYWRGLFPTTRVVMLVSHLWRKGRLVCTSLSGTDCRLRRWRYVGGWDRNNCMLMLLEWWWCGDRRCRRWNCRHKLIQQRPEGKFWRNSYSSKSVCRRCFWKMLTSFHYTRSLPRLYFCDHPCKTVYRGFVMPN